VAAQREWFEKDYYKVLGVAPDATAKDVTKAYRRLARQYHPDANQGDPTAEERFKEISAAYDVVGDEAKRKDYDEARRLGPMAGGFGSGAGGNPFGDGVRFESADLGDLLGGLFGRGNRGGRGGAGAGPQRGADLEANLTLNFDDAVAGITTTLSLVSDAQCGTCSGSGARPGTSPKTCPTCHGRGVTDDPQGLFSFSSPCGTCAGRGVVIEHPCATCRGTGVERRPREVKVRIPSGVADGQRIRLKGRGAPGRNGGPPGDLFVTCQIPADPVFGRDGNHVLVTVPLTFAEATLGAEVLVPAIGDGGIRSSVRLRVPPGTSPGTRQRVRGKGIATAKGAGDLVVTWDVIVPKKLTAAQRKAVEDLAKVTDDGPRAHLGV
jgi:molecular chaperone DnaJ